MLEQEFIRGPRAKAAVSGKSESWLAQRFDAVVFDLDGTLLDTLPDLVRLTNAVLAEHGWPERTRDEVLSYVGDGGRALLGRAAPAGTADADLDEAFARWRELYPTLGHALTQPYPGIPELLAELKRHDVKLGVLSNKFDAAAREVVAEHFPGMFDLVRGECAEIPRKPDPAGLQFMMRALNVSPAHVAYVGDSATDMQVAVAAGAFPVAVGWGYQPESALRAAGAMAFL